MAREDDLQGGQERRGHRRPDLRASIKARGRADVLAGPNEKDLLIGGKRFDVGFGKGGKDRWKLIERRGCR